MKHTLSGDVTAWNLFGNRRQLAAITVPYEVAHDLFKSTCYDGRTGRGEQREVHEAHCRKLEREIRNGNYTPTPIAVSTYKSHRAEIRLDNGTFELDVDSANPLPLTDGGHRLGALKNILKSLNERLKATKDDAEKQLFAAQIDEVNKLPITVTLYLDGDPQVDFINLQAGRSVDPSHILTLRIHRKIDSTPELEAAFEIAKLLASVESGPYVGQIRFDSRGRMPLPISTLCMKGSSDLSTSLVGLAKVSGEMQPAEIAAIIDKLYQKLCEECPEVLEYGKFLTPMGNGGTKGSATMLIGVAICFVHDLIALGSIDHEARLNAICESVSMTLDTDVVGRFSSGDKRALMGAFATNYFEASDVEKHNGVPVSLLNLLSATTYACSPLPKEPKAAKPKTAKPQAAARNTVTHKMTKESATASATPEVMLLPPAVEVEPAKEAAPELVTVAMQAQPTEQKPAARWGFSEAESPWDAVVRTPTEEGVVSIFQTANPKHSRPAGPIVPRRLNRGRIFNPGSDEARKECCSVSELESVGGCGRPLPMT